MTVHPLVLGFKFSTTRLLVFSVAFTFHDDLVGVVRQAVQGALCQDRVVEERDPFLHCAVAREDRRGAPMTLDDDLVDVARLSRIKPAKPEVINDQQIGCKETPQGLFVRVITAGLTKFLEHLVGPDEEHTAPSPASGVPEGGSQKSLPDADRTEEEGVLSTLEKSETEEIAHLVAIEGDFRIPIEPFKGLFLCKAGSLQTQLEVVLIPPVNLVLKDQLQEVLGRQFGLFRVGHPIWQGRQDP